MASSNYDASLARVLKHEGGYTNHPADPGGPTNFGITIHDYRRYIKADGTADDVKAMTLAQAAQIYRARYWNALRCDELPSGLDYAMFDYGVNSGIARAAKVLQRLLGQPANGVMSNELVAGARAANASALVERLCDERLAFLKSLRTWPVFGAGWGRRVAEVRRDALAMAKGGASAPASSSVANGKAKVPARKRARAATSAGTVAAGGAAANAAHAAGAPLSLVAAIVAGTAGLAIAGWIGWTLWHRRKQDAPASASGGFLASLRQKLKGWRTLLFGCAVSATGAALDILDALQLVDITPLLPPAHALKIIAVIGVVTVLLRVVTTGRIGQRDF